MDTELDTMRQSLIGIAAETFRFRGIFERVVGRLDITEQAKYMSQYAWFSKRVTRALEAAGLRLVDLTGELYDPGMAVTPLDLDGFEPEDRLYIAQMIEPVIMQGTDVVREGTVLLGRIEG